jgi:methionyl aminopeptidase
MIALRSEREIGLLRDANQVVAAVHAALASMIEPGVTTGELDAAAEDIIRSRGGEPAFKGYHGFPASTCISIESEVVHGIPGTRRLEAGEIVSIDVGVRLKGYYGDAAVTRCCGAVDEGRRKLLDTTEAALGAAIAAAKAGNWLRDIGRAIERVCNPKGYGIVRNFVGHGIGTEMHEEPQVPNYDTGERGPRLKAGMVLAIEPMVNMGTHEVKVLKDGWTVVTRDGKPSAHFEHSVVVREDGGEVLSASPECQWGLKSASIGHL